MDFRSVKKVCTACKIAKDLDQFAISRKKADGRTNLCRPCKKGYNADYYARTKEVHNPGRYERLRAAREEIRNKVMQYLSEHPCVDCGETDIVVLDFDHQRDKEFDVHKMLTKFTHWPRIATEIAKCDVVCANDHRRRTARTQGWARAIFQPPLAQLGRAADS